MGEVFGERFRRLRLHAKIAFSILALILVIFGALLSIYLSTVRTVIAEENRRRAELLAAQLAQHLSSEPTLDLPTLHNEAFYYKRAHSEIAEIHIYGLTRSGVREAVALPMSASEGTVPLDLLGEAQRGRIVSRVEGETRGNYRIVAGAPIESEGRLVGFVLVRAEIGDYTALLKRMSRLTWLAFLATVGGITAAVHVLFRRLIYRPIRAILDAMHRAEAGDLQSTSLSIPRTRWERSALG